MVWLPLAGCPVLPLWCTSLVMCVPMHYIMFLSTPSALSCSSIDKSLPRSSCLVQRYHPSSDPASHEGFSLLIRPSVDFYRTPLYIPPPDLLPL